MITHTKVYQHTSIYISTIVMTFLKQLTISWHGKKTSRTIYLESCSFKKTNMLFYLSQGIKHAQISFSHLSQ